MAESPRTLLKVAALLSIPVVAGSAWVLDLRRKAERDQLDVAREREAANPDVVPADVQEARFKAEADPDLQARALTVARSFQGRLDVCTEAWPRASARAWLATDDAGRLRGLALEGAPEAVRACVEQTMAAGRYPFSREGSLELPLRADR